MLAIGLTLFCWFAVLFFFGASAWKFKEYADKPMHGRQDLYPVPGERPDRAEYGGSYYEEQRWFEKEHHKNHVGEIKDMLIEIFFIKKLFTHQRKLWWMSYSLHLGIYFVFAAIAIAFATVLLPFTGILASLLGFAVMACGSIGGLLVVVGTCALLYKRITDHEFRNYTTPQEYFNLGFLCLGAITGLLAFITNGFSFGFVKKIVWNMLHLKPMKGLNKPAILHLLVFGALIIYIPVTKMSHYVGKYFAFHKVLWDNAPNLRGSKVESTIEDEASIKPSADMQWSAPHYHPAPEKTEEK